ncbi:MAG: hypothetical protein QM736_22925 [Vicinamibacterales bacterium]
MYALRKIAQAWRSQAAFALGLVLPLAATVTLFAAAGEIDGLFYWNVTHNLEYLQEFRSR